jgi:hypothetical protein
MTALVLTVRLWLANRLLTLAWLALPADLVDERERLRRLRLGDAMRLGAWSRAGPFFFGVSQT